MYIFSDAAVSGSTPLMLREGSAALLKAANNGVFDILLLESLDRLSRDQVEQEQVVRKLEFLGIRIIGVCDGYDSNLSSRKVLRSVRGLVNELYLDDLRLKTHRGLTGQVNRGYAAGGKSYGYDLVKTEGGSRYQINEKEAHWVLYIFEEYSKGVSIQRIAHRLNQLSVPSPRGGAWAVSAIYGSPLKWSGILNNRMYIGQLIWNRSQWVKHPETGKRKRIIRPESEWVIKNIPELRILSDELWNKVRHRMDSGRDEMGYKRYGKQSMTLLGGLLRCPYCKGAMVAVNSRSYGCCATKDRGKSVCPGLLIKKSVVEHRFIEYIKQKLVGEKSMKAFEAEFKKVIDTHLSSRGNSHDLKKRLETVTQGINRVVAALTEIAHSEALLNQLKKLEVEKEVIKRHIANASIQYQYPDIATLFMEAVEELSLYFEEDKQKARVLLQGLFDNIQLLDINGAIIAKLDRDRTLELITKTHIKEPVYKRGCEGRQPRLETESHTNYDYVFLYDIDKT